MSDNTDAADLATHTDGVESSDTAGGDAVPVDSLDAVSEILSQLEAVVPGTEQRPSKPGRTTDRRLRYVKIRLHSLQIHLEQLLAEEFDPAPTPEDDSDSDLDLRYID